MVYLKAVHADALSVVPTDKVRLTHAFFLLAAGV